MASERPFELGDWRVEPARGAIAPLSGGPETRLEPKLMDLLLLFAGSGGRVLSKDEIIGGVWGGRAIGDDTLAAAMSRLRRALGETREHRYIETLPKRGYRLLGAVEGPMAAAPGREPPREAAELLAKARAALAAPLGLAQARLYFDAAVKAAPGWAPAHAGLAEALIAEQLTSSAEGLLTAAKAEARTATLLDESLAAGWAALGLAMLLAERAFEPADAALRRAIALDPGLGPTRRHHAFALAAVGRFVEAERAARKAVELEPVSL
uniref:winged helix-turn-helix domain-containing protein n=1 Tax=Phenylobacterium sp. TaxID=1871053 RepID=UPI00261FDFDF